MNYWLGVSVTFWHKFAALLTNYYSMLYSVLGFVTRLSTFTMAMGGIKLILMLMLYVLFNELCLWFK